MCHLESCEYVMNEEFEEENKPENEEGDTSAMPIDANQPIEEDPQELKQPSTQA